MAFHLVSSTAMMLLLIVLCANIAQLYFMKESMKGMVTKTRQLSERVRDNVVCWHTPFRRNDQRTFERSRDSLERLISCLVRMMSMLALDRVWAGLCIVGMMIFRCFAFYHGVINMPPHYASYLCLLLHYASREYIKTEPRANNSENKTQRKIT
jgi:hypothetical protein